ncbi:hypothetical protein ARC78_07090 [Stenotrophomonas pictorum JCM 9942]|uniref:Uncharacterized protein n=2 Tax=Stenotrophomonas pictorum TaxID=86184 RepID=A0A0R0AQW5_9GAMM|nr:hypothetical protein ARC78_07090 [Stenotrophomonas pictorum JCM 9942]
MTVGVAVLALLLMLVRQPLADWLWPETKIQQLLDEGERALAEGRLSAPDGSGARERFQAAAALDPDRRDVQDALGRTGQAALQQARHHLAAGDYDAARSALALARQLQLPEREIETIATALQRVKHDGGGVERLLQQAQAAQAQGRLDEGPDSALPLYQQVLAIQPDRMQALEGREDALSDLLLQAKYLARQGKVEDAAQRLYRVEEFDPGHYDLPSARAVLSGALEQARRKAERDFARGRLQAAAAGLRQVLAASPADEAARQGLHRIARAQAAEAVRLAGDFHFDDAEQALVHARALAPGIVEIAAAEQTLARARAAQRSMDSSVPAARRERQLRVLLAQLEQAEAQGQWLLPPGNSAYDRFKAAQALAPRDPRVRQAAARILPAARACLEDNLRGNRLRAARTCLDAWQALAPGDVGLAAARRRLAQRWIAVGSERLGAGDAAFAVQALAQAREVDPATPEINAFAERLRGVQPLR